MPRLMRKPGGEALEELRSLGIGDELGDRIADILQRRNDIVHHPAELVVLGKGLRGIDVAAAVNWVEQLVSECETLASEIGAPAFDAVFAALGKTPEQVAAQAASLDPEDVGHERLRRGVAAALEVICAEPAQAAESDSGPV
jgi:hypothetical protein